MIIMENRLPKRKHPRLNNYDYSSTGAYFVTICTQDRTCLLSRIVGRGLAPADIEYTEYGRIAMQQLLSLGERYPYLKIDRYVVMPNHIHIILFLDYRTAGASPRPTVMDIICTYKSLTTKKCKELKPIDKLFQTSFHEHIIRDRSDYENIVKYILDNPYNWHHDELYRQD